LIEFYNDENDVVSYQNILAFVYTEIVLVARRSGWPETKL